MRDSSIDLLRTALHGMIANPLPGTPRNWRVRAIENLGSKPRVNGPTPLEKTEERGVSASSVGAPECAGKDQGHTIGHGSAGKSDIEPEVDGNDDGQHRAQNTRCRIHRPSPLYDTASRDRAHLICRNRSRTVDGNRSQAGGKRHAHGKSQGKKEYCTHQ